MVVQRFSYATIIMVKEIRNCCYSKANYYDLLNEYQHGRRKGYQERDIETNY